MGYSFSHIINPVIVPPSSDLFIAQPITFESLCAAKRLASKSIDVNLYSAEYQEDRPLVPEWILKTPYLTRSAMDFVESKNKRKLPFISDILANLYQATDADYLVYTNVDISVQPSFYLDLNDLATTGLDAFIINRRTIPGHYSSIDELPFMYTEIGLEHPGFDCFVFKRELFESFRLGNTFIGADWIGKIFLLNLAYSSKTFSIFKDLHLTFHIGDDRAWNVSAFDAYNNTNKKEAALALEVLENTYGAYRGNKDIQRHYRLMKKYRNIL